MFAGDGAVVTRQPDSRAFSALKSALYLLPPGVRSAHDQIIEITDAVNRWPPA